MLGNNLTVDCINLRWQFGLWLTQDALPFGVNALDFRFYLRLLGLHRFDWRVCFFCHRSLLFSLFTALFGSITRGIDFDFFLKKLLSILNCDRSISDVIVLLLMWDWLFIAFLTFIIFTILNLLHQLTVFFRIIFRIWSDITWSIKIHKFVFT